MRHMDDDVDDVKNIIYIFIKRPHTARTAKKEQEIMKSNIFI